MSYKTINCPNLKGILIFGTHFKYFKSSNCYVLVQTFYRLDLA